MSCRNPFEVLYVLPDGFTACCQSWLDKKFWLVPLDSADPWQIWNHHKLQDLRIRVASGLFGQCRACPRLQTGQVPELADDTPLMTRGPKTIILCNDLACNLSCPSCRPKLITRTAGQEKRRATMLAILGEFLPTAERVVLLQSGEVFASPMHLEWLQSVNASALPDLRITITTNGLLLPQSWPKIASAHPAIDELSISIDAATPETYATVRRGGTWPRLIEALEFAAEVNVRRQFNFCVQAANVAELEAFAALGERYKADRIKYTTIRQWHQSDEEFAAMNVADPRHESHAELRRQLSQPWAKSPRVDVTQLQGAAETTRVTA